MKHQRLLQEDRLVADIQNEYTTWYIKNLERIALTSIYEYLTYHFEVNWVPNIQIFSDGRSMPVPQVISDNWYRESYSRYCGAVWLPVVDNTLDYVSKRWIMQRICISNIQPRAAAEHATRGYWQSVLSSNRSGWKSCIQSVPCHQRNSLQVSARLVLTRLRCAKRKCSDAWLLERPPFWTCCSPQEAFPSALFDSLVLSWPDNQYLHAEYGQTVRAVERCTSFDGVPRISHFPNTGAGRRPVNLVTIH